MSNSALVNVVIKSPNCNKPRNKAITKITIHHMAGFMSVEECGNLFANPSREASANYGIGSDGRVGLYVDECDRAWTSGSPENDNMAVTIEVANCKGAPNWEVSDEAYSKLIDLCVDICKRNGIEALNWTGDAQGNLTCHYMFQPTACPGPYLKSKMGDIAREVNARLGVQPAPTPSVSKPDVYYAVKTAESGWLPFVKNLEDYAGLYGQKILDVAIRVSNGDIWYQSRTVSGRMLGVITGCDINDFDYGFSGDDTPMATLVAYYTTPQDIINAIGYLRIKYRVHRLGGGWYDWQYDNEVGGGQDGYAGVPGVAIDGLQMILE